MEVETGAVKAIANLTRIDSGKYVEILNYAVGKGTVPGSTFKLASLIAVIEDFGVELEDTITVGNGVTYFSGVRVRDSHEPKKSVMTVQEIFAQSSNVGVTKLIHRYYSKNPKKYINKLYRMELNTPLKISIPGEAIPYIKDIDDKSWSKISLPWISYGYETKLSPLQILTFYNAVANNGVMMRPAFVKEVATRGKTVEVFKPQIINHSICSQSTVKKAKIMMEGVVSKKGTASSLMAANYKIAGKTGTAQIGKVNGKMRYLASFVGYFPADNPKYSCIVVVSAPTGDSYYGGAVAGPVFKDVADKVYSTSLDIHEEINKNTTQIAINVPKTKDGSEEEISTALSVLRINSKTEETKFSSSWVSTSTKNDTTIKIIYKRTEEYLSNGVIPNIIGMTGKDVLYLLENKGIRVQLVGNGAVIKQSLRPGTPYTKGTLIKVKLI
jgi:cell division protein FtsI (penicillin-binding protein 3)